MNSIGVSYALAYVRRALDEVTNLATGDMLGALDDAGLSQLVEGHLPEAAVRVHLAAPSDMLEGEAGKLGTDYTASIPQTEAGVVEITMKKPTVRFARIKVSDSNTIVTDLVPENSPEGRKQLDAFVRGIPEDPRAVLQKKWAGVHLPIVKYYTTGLTALKETDVEVEYIPYPALETGEVAVSPRLEYAVLNELTALVLESLSQTDKAAVYRAKSQEYLQGK